MDKDKREEARTGEMVPLDLTTEIEVPTGIAIGNSRRFRKRPITSAQSNVAALRETLLELETQGIVSFVNIEVPPIQASSPRMSVKQFRDAYANKPGATFYCPDHLKHELDSKD
jgi:hypothetical protein